MQAMKRVGKVFNEFDSDSAIMIVLEGDKPLGDDAHIFYNGLIQQLEADKQHVEHVQDFWGDPLTAAGSQSTDGKSAYVQVYLVGNQGESKANDSVKAVRKIVGDAKPPQGVKAYVTGAAALTADQSSAGEKGVIKVTILTFIVIILILLWVYRSIVTVFITLLMVFIELFAARQVVSLLACNNIIGLSTFAVNLLVLMAIAAGTDYAIFVLGRYQEARSLGEDREQAFYTMFHGTAHVVLGSGLTIAGAMYCLSFTRLPYFQTLGAPCAVGMIVAVFAAGITIPFRLDTTQGPFLNGECTNDVDHEWIQMHESWNGGANDGWLPAQAQTQSEANTPLTMGYHTRQDIPIHYMLADAFTLCDHYHCSLLGPTLPNRLYWLSASIDPAGTNGGPVLVQPSIAPVQKYSWRLMPENLSDAGVSWKIYVSNRQNQSSIWSPRTA